MNTKCQKSQATDWRAEPAHFERFLKLDRRENFLGALPAALNCWGSLRAVGRTVPGLRSFRPAVGRHLRVKKARKSRLLLPGGAWRAWSGPWNQPPRCEHNTDRAPAPSRAPPRLLRFTSSSERRAAIDHARRAPTRASRWRPRCRAKKCSPGSSSPLRSRRSPRSRWRGKVREKGRRRPLPLRAPTVDGTSALLSATLRRRPAELSAPPPAAAPPQARPSASASSPRTSSRRAAASACT